MEQKTDIKKVMDQTDSLGMFWVLLAYPAVLLVKVYRFFFTHQTDYSRSIRGLSISPHLFGIRT